jgi:arylsulfatase A-like enzyme
MYLDDDSQFGHADLFKHLGGKENLYRPLPEAERQNLIDLYDGEIRYVDDRLLAPLVARLKALDLYDRTLIVFLSDHGEEFFEHGSWGHGQSLYDELLKVPLVLKLPGSEFGGMAPQTIVSLVDVLPTLVDVMGWDSFGRDWDGRSLVPVFQGKETEDRMFLADIGSNVLRTHVPQKIATNRGRIKMILNEAYSVEDLEFFRFEPPPLGPVELFDLAADPGEQGNIADARPSLANDILRWINDFYARARKAETRKARIDQSVRDQLKALGYIR